MNVLNVPLCGIQILLTTLQLTKSKIKQVKSLIYIQKDLGADI